jgi:2-polyprenyl-3-methyl-5-hydroxy-6-metoxy-1,4-benzoquinol methylase
MRETLRSEIRRKQERNSPSYNLIDCAPNAKFRLPCGTQAMDATPAPERFAFGENWRSFANTVDEDRMRQARLGLRKLFPDGKIACARFLDIGCGSGLSLLAALQLGAELVHGIDVDPDSVTATRSLLTKFGPPERWSVECADALSFSAAPFDIVYSWGVLHHTGAMREAIRSAAQLVKPGGFFAFALYRRTRMCWFWRQEKRWYSARLLLGRNVPREMYTSPL